MRVLLDTHILYWWFSESARISPKAFKTISEAEVVFVSSASIWEISIKARLGKIDADPQRLFDQMTIYGFHELPVWSKHAMLVAKLPMHHADPFDRLLVAQAISEPLHLLTVDTQLLPYSELVIQV
jgi:PIN domain nuclease of toxin-antitoxin system